MDKRKIFENRVARKWCVEGSFLRWWYVISSIPGEDLEEHRLSIRLIQPGVIGDRSKAEETTGGG